MRLSQEDKIAAATIVAKRKDEEKAVIAEISENKPESAESKRLPSSKPARSIGQGSPKATVSSVVVKKPKLNTPISKISKAKTKTPVSKIKEIKPKAKMANKTKKK